MKASRLRNRSLLPIAVLFLFVLSFTPSVPAATTNFYLASPGSGANLAGVYTSPYTGSVTGPTGPLIPVICDDFANESYIPEDWTAYVTPLSGLTASTDGLLRWSGASASFTMGSTTYEWSLNQATAYTVAAVLAIDILQSNSNTTAGLQAQQDYSFALWELFDAGTPADPGVVAWLGTNYQSTLLAATADVLGAISEVATQGLTQASFPNVTIYSYDPPNQGGETPECGNPLAAGCTTLPPQEFITVTPEPSGIVLFGTGLLGIIVVTRRKPLRNL